VAGRDYRDFVRSIFEPLTSAADRPDLLENLTTEHVDPDRKDEQFERFKTFEIDLSDVVYLPNGGFVALYRHCGGKYVAVSSAGLIAQDEVAITQWAIDHGFEPDSFDECTFICFVHHLSGYYKLADRFRAPQDALDVIDVIGKGYEGHAFEDLVSYYRPVLVFKIPLDSTYAASDIFDVATDLCCKIEALRSAIVDSELANVILELSQTRSVPNENLFQAITASHFRHAFLELYRCLESIFYLPWMLELKAAGKIQTRACDLKLTCRTALQWREKELPSMERLFSLIASDKRLDVVEDSVELFTELKNSVDFSRGQLGKRVYAIRNGMVHHEDYEEPNQYKPNDNQWRSLSLYIALVLAKITIKYERDLTPVEKSPGHAVNEPISACDMSDVAAEVGNKSQLA
jgi:hypothetical protein